MINPTILAVLCLPTLPAAAATIQVAFSIQANQLTWFSVENPAVQGAISVTGLPSNLAGNALAYDPGSQRLLFVDGNAATNHTLYSVGLGGLTLESGLSVEAQAAASVGTIAFGAPRELLGGGFHNGSYYTLINGTDSLVKVDFAAGGTIASTLTIDLPGTNTMFLGDLAFDGNGTLWVSGFNQIAGGINDDRLWHYSSSDGTTFVSQGAINPAGTRYNGIFFDVTQTNLYGYRLASTSYGIINQIDGSSTVIYNGVPFDSGGDLSDGFMFEVIPEPSIGALVVAGACLGLMRRRRTSGS